MVSGLVGFCNVKFPFSIKFNWVALYIIFISFDSNKRRFFNANDANDAKKGGLGRLKPLSSWSGESWRLKVENSGKFSSFYGRYVTDGTDV